MAKVYVSSTVADLERERQAVTDWLVAARHQPVHSYLPSSGTVRGSCLDDVDTCDLYVLIVGDRYGFRPEDGNPEGLSITHLEFRRAGQSGIPRVALLRPSIPGAGRSVVGGAQQAALVAAFRAEVIREVRAAEFRDLTGLIQALSTGVQGELDKLSPAGRVLRLAPRPRFLAGRHDLLAELDARLTGDGGAGPRVVALCGLGGAGKTSVALEYAHRHLAEVAVAWQLPAEDPAVLAAGFAELAAQLGVLGQAGNLDPVAAVHGALASYRAGWLLVFDNAPDRAAVAALVPPGGRGRILVTSRNPNWPPVEAVDVPVLDTDVAAQFLAARTGDQDHQSALELAGELGGLPLALEQAAAYIQATGDSLGGYLDSFRQRRPDMLARGEPTGYDSTVAATWILAFGRLERSAPQAAGLLRLLAFCAPEAVPLRLLLQSRRGLTKGLRRRVAKVLERLDDPLAASDAVAALGRYSLVTPAGGGLISVHRLVQAVTADQMSPGLREGWRAAAAALIEAAIPADTSSPESWPTCAALLPHAQVVLADDSDGMTQLANYLGHQGNRAAALELWRRVFTARERSLGSKHPDTLVARFHLANGTGQAGDAAGARDQCAALLPVMEQMLGAEHLGTLATRSDLASWTGVAGDAAGARDQFAALLPVMQRVLGAEHPHTLEAQAYLVRWIGVTGDAAGARDQLAELLPIHERVFGPEEPGNLVVRGNLAAFTGAAGDAAGARDQLSALLPVMERVLGAEHVGTLTPRLNLAHWTGEAGDAAGARDQLAELLPIRERVSGPEDPGTLDTRANLATWTGKAGDAEGARDQFTALLPVNERVLGAEHPSTLTARANLARWTGAAGDAAEARDQLAALLPVMERVLGADHPSTLAASAELALWTLALWAQEAGGDVDPSVD
jgi:Domain of unknown function (DUF4062)/Tetratricopeptide repeat